jgi:hypothetical protein
MATALTDVIGDYKPFALVDAAGERMASRERVPISNFPMWAKQQEGNPKFSGWLGSSWFSPSSPKLPRVVAAGKRTIFPSTGEIYDLDIMELRSAYLDRTYWGGPKSRPKWSARDVETLEKWGGLSMPIAHRGDRPPSLTEPLVELDSVSDWWQFLMAVGTRVELDPVTGRWWGEGRWPAATDLRHTKLYVSICSHAFWRRWGERWVKGEAKQVPNPWYQPQMVHLLCRVEHAKAQEAISLFGAVAVSTDSVWVPERNVEAATTWYWERWGEVKRPKRRWGPRQVWPWRGNVCSVVEQPPEVRENLSAGLRPNLPANPLAPMSQATRDRIYCGQPSQSAGNVPLSQGAKGPGLAPAPSVPMADIEERKAFLRRQFTAGELAPPPVQPWQADVAQLVEEEGRQLFVPPPDDEPWLVEGWALVEAPLPDWAYARQGMPTWVPIEVKAPVEPLCNAFHGRSPPTGNVPLALRGTRRLDAN